MSDQELRRKIKILKATEAIENYYEIAELLEISCKSFYNWLGGYYNLSESKKKNLIEIINDLTIAV